MENIDYLYRLSHLIRKKILKLDRGEQKTNKMLFLRNKLMNLNYGINKKIRDICVDELYEGRGELNIGEFLN